MNAPSSCLWTIWNFFSSAWRIPIVVFLIQVALGLPAQAQGFSFNWTLKKEGSTSAGVYDAQGRLTRVLWTMEKMSAGAYQSSWDGLTDDGKPAPAGDYSWKVVVNRATYENVGTIGNTGKPANSFGHVPFFIEGVDLDSQGNAYSVHDWNEAGHDIKKWSAATGQPLLETGHVISEALLKGIAVEPDGSYAYVTGYGGADVNDRDHIRFSIFKVKIAQEPQAAVENFTQAGRSIVVYDGSANYPAGATSADIDVMRVPLISVALQGNSVYVTDALGGRILKYDKTTGQLQQQISNVPLACGIAVAADGKIWVGHEHKKISVYSPEGARLATPITNLVEVRALSIQGNILCVADRSAKIFKYTLNGTKANRTVAFGLTARPGDYAPERLSNINGAAMDVDGSVVVSDRMGEGARLQKFTPALKQQWEQLCLEFSSQAAFGKENPDLAISSFRNIYKINRATGTWEFLGPGGTEEPGAYFGNFGSTHGGPPRVVRFGGTDFFYYPAGDSLAVYRLVASKEAGRGPTLVLASCLGGSMPSPDGVKRDQWWEAENKYLWSWDDLQGDGAIQYGSVSAPKEVTLDASPNSPSGWKWDRASLGVDDHGWLWLTSYARVLPGVPYESKAIYVVPPQGVNKRGNPIYRWADAVKVMDENTGRDAVEMADGQEFNWMMANRSDDGMVYSLAYAAKPSLPQDGARWMGGNVLFGFDGQNGAAPAAMEAPKWKIVLPEKSVGMTPIPGGAGGVFVGVRPAHRATIGHYTRDGLLIGTFNAAEKFGNDVSPNYASGALDSFLALNCNRDPRDGVIDVFAEDNWNQRLLWYRVNDKDIETLSGTGTASGGSAERHALTVNDGTGDGNYPAGSVANIAAAVPPPGKMFAEWTGDVTGLASKTSAVTTLTMPAGPATVTATYIWATGNDRVRFFPRAGDERRLLNCVFEGTNGDPATGPYTPFYVVPEIPPAGWTSVPVNLGSYRYLRFRDPDHNGMIAEVEFYRKGAKLAGEGFGTPGAWNNETDHEFPAALDGDPNTYFNGPDVRGAYLGIDTFKPTASSHVLKVNNGSGSGAYEAGTTVPVSANPPDEGSAFAGWHGDIVIMSNPFIAATTALVPYQDVEITATYVSQSAPVVKRAYLRNDHGPGNFVDIEIFGLGATSNVESRNGFETARYKLMLEFDQAVTAGNVLVADGGAEVTSILLTGRTAEVILSKVKDKRKVTVSLKGFANGGSPVGADSVIAIRFLAGDANRDGIVTAAEVLEIRDAQGRVYGEAGFNPNQDYDTDGVIDAQDYSTARLNTGASVAP